MEFQNMMAFIHENYARKLTLEDIAQAGLIGFATADGQALELVAWAGYPVQAVTPWRRIPLGAATPLTEVAQAVVMPASHPLAAKRQVRLRDLEGERLVDDRVGRSNHRRALVWGKCLTPERGRGRRAGRGGAAECAAGWLRAQPGPRRPLARAVWHGH